MKILNSFLLFFAILLVALGTRFYWESQKTAFHVDEVMSFVLCDYGELGWTKTFEGEHTGAEAKRMMLFPHPGFDDAIQDIKHNWQDNRDHYHTNFYYTILRLWLVGFQSYNIHDIIVHCLWLNYIFFIAYFVLLYFFLRLFFRDNPKILFIGLLLIGLSASDIANTIFIREYMLQELGALLVAFIAVKATIKIQRGTYDFSISNFLLITFAVWLVIFNGYFQFVYVGIIGSYILWTLYKRKNYVGIVFFTMAMVVAVVFCCLCYHGFFKILTEDNKVSGGVMSRGIRGMVTPFWSYIQLLCHYTLYLPYLFIVAYVFYCKKKLLKEVPWIFWCALAYSVMAIWVTPIISNRYIVSVTSLLILIVPWSLSQLSGKKQKFAILICVLTSVIMVLFKGNIENLNYDINEKANLLNNGSKMPTYIIQNKQQCWTLCDIIPYLNDGREYTFVNSIDEIQCNAPHIVSIDCFRTDYPVEKMKNKWQYMGYGSFYNHYLVK